MRLEDAAAHRHDGPTEENNAVVNQITHLHVAEEISRPAPKRIIPNRTREQIKAPNDDSDHGRGLTLTPL